MPPRLRAKQISMPARHYRHVLALRQNPERKKQYRADKLEDQVDRESDNSKRQEDQPNEREKKRHEERNRPADDQ